jgi:flagellar protein FlaG
MVDDITTVIAAPARTPALSVPNKATVPAEGLPGGKDRSAIGQNLPPPPAVAAEEVERALRRLNEMMARNQRSLRFQFDELSGRTIITVLDEVTKEVVRQIPAPELLAVMRRLEDQSGSLLDVVG